MTIEMAIAFLIALSPAAFAIGGAVYEIFVARPARRRERSDSLVDEIVRQASTDRSFWR